MSLEEFCKKNFISYKEASLVLSNFNLKKDLRKFNPFRAPDFQEKNKKTRLENMETNITITWRKIKRHA